MAQWCNPVTLQPEQLGGVGSIPGRTPPLERHDKESRTQSALLHSQHLAVKTATAPVRKYFEVAHIEIFTI